MPELSNIKQKLLANPLVKFLLKYELWLSLLVFAGLWAGFLVHSNTLTSGYHLIDDHEMLDIAHDLSTNNPVAVSIKWINSDLNARFRPVYFIHRVFSLWVVGTNFQALSLLLFVMAAITSWLLYLFARKIGFGRITSFLFVFLTLLGTQAGIWWRLGPSESIGILWLAPGLLFMAKSVFDAPEHRLRTSVIALASIIIASLSKESFVILLPAVMFWWILLYHNHAKANWIQTLKHYAAEIILTGIVCVAELAVIFLKVGTTGIGYAGADASSLSLRSILGTWKVLFMSTNPWLILGLAGLLLFILIVKFINSSGNLRKRIGTYKDQYLRIIYAGILVALITISQAALYAKSGISERYLVPGSLGLAFIVVFLITEILRSIRRRELKLLIAAFLIIATLLSLWTQYANARSDAKFFAADGHELNDALGKLVSTTANDDIIVLIADPAYDFEASISTETFLHQQAAKTQIYILPYWTQPADTYSAFHTELGNYYISSLKAKDANAITDRTKVRAVFTYQATDKALSQNYPDWFSTLGYTRFDYDRYVVYVQNR